MQFGFHGTTLIYSTPKYVSLTQHTYGFGFRYNSLQNNNNIYKFLNKASDINYCVFGFEISRYKLIKNSRISHHLTRFILTVGYEILVADKKLSPYRLLHQN